MRKVCSFSIFFTIVYYQPYISRSRNEKEGVMFLNFFHFSVFSNFFLYVLFVFFLRSVSQSFSDVKEFCNSAIQKSSIEIVLA